jgi:predicted DNA-binding protein (UPF0251 family)
LFKTNLLGLGCKNMRKRAGRPCLKRRINFNPEIKYFKPRGVPLSSLETVELKTEELEAFRLRYLENFDQRECAEKMHTSPATVQRILTSGSKKIADALSVGKAIRIAEN